MHAETSFEPMPITGFVQPEEYLAKIHGRLYSGFGWLDSLVGGFQAPELILLDSTSPFVFGLLSELCVQAVTQYGAQAIFVDGGNSIRPYEIARIAKFKGQEPNSVLSRINVARAFTAHQLAALINEELEPILESTDASTVIVSSLLDLFLDPDMRWNESFQLVKRSMATLDRITKEREIVCIISNFGAGKLQRTRALASTMNGYPDRVIRMESTGSGMLVSLPRRGTYLYRYPVPQGQTVLERYFRGCSYGQDCGNL